MIKNELNFVEYDKKYAEQCHRNFLGQLETSKYTLWKPTQNVEDAERKLEFWTSDLKGNDIFWLILDKKNQAIGFICAGESSPGVFGDIGIAIGKEFLHNGYGTMALNELLKVIKERDGKEVHYSHFEENEASKRLAMKFGFEFYKRDVRLRKYDNKEFNELFYVLKIK